MNAQTDDTKRIAGCTVAARPAPWEPGPPAVFNYRPHVSNLLFWLLVGPVCVAVLALIAANATSDSYSDGEGGGFLIVVLALPLLSPFGVISYFLRHQVEFAPRGLEFKGTWQFFGPDPSYVPYGMIQQARRTMLGGVEVRYGGKDFLGDGPGDQRRTVYLAERERFLAELSARTNAVIRTG